LLLALSVTAVASASAAPPKGPKSDPAQALFDKGVADMEAGRFEKACPAIEASQRMDPRPGTLFTLAECEAKRGRTATAARHYSEYLALYRTFGVQKKNEQYDRAQHSEAQLRKLEPLVPHLTLLLPAQAGPDVVVKCDGDVVAELSLGTALPVDPGDHVVTTQAPGGLETEHRISLASGEKRMVTLTVRHKPPAVPTATASVTAPPPRLPPQLDPRPWRIGALSAGVAAVAGLVVGTVAGVLALDQRTIVDRNCQPAGNNKEACTPAGLDARHRLDALGAASTIGFVVGGVGIGVGVALLVAAPSAPTPNPGVGQSGSSAFITPKVGVSVGGSF
jgi:hypothetical protein